MGLRLARRATILISTACINGPVMISLLHKDSFIDSEVHIERQPWGGNGVPYGSKKF